MGFDSSFGSLFCTLSTCHLDLVASCWSPYHTPWRSGTLHVAYTTLGVSAFATILHSRTQVHAAHSTKSPVRVGQVCPCRICRRAARLKDPARLGFCWPFRSLHAHLPELQIPPCRPPLLQSALLLSAARLLPFRRSLCPSCACLLLLFTESSSCRRSFFNWATPVKLCSSVFCMLIDCLLHQLLGSKSQKLSEFQTATHWWASK